MVDCGKGRHRACRPARAFLWIPPNCQKIRGVVLAQHNMEEISILENPKFRRALAELGLAEIWCNPRFDHLFRFNQGAGETFKEMMEDLAKESGYDELKYVPVIGIGHSAAASWPYYFAAWNPERTLAAISVSGQWPYFRSQVFAPDIWGDRNIDFIPSLETMGEYEAANTWSTEGLKQRQQHPFMPRTGEQGPSFEQSYRSGRKERLAHRHRHPRGKVPTQYAPGKRPGRRGIPHRSPKDQAGLGQLD